MAVYSEGRYIDRITDAALTVADDNFRIVKQQSSTANPTGRKVVLASAASDNFMGVLNMDSDVVAGETVSVCGRNAEGTFKVVLGGTVAIGDDLTSDSTGAAITTTTGGDQVIGVAQEAGVAGQVIEYRPTDRKH